MCLPGSSGDLQPRAALSAETHALKVHSSNVARVLMVECDSGTHGRLSAILSTRRIWTHQQLLCAAHRFCLVKQHLRLSVVSVHGQTLPTTALLSCCPLLMQHLHRCCLVTQTRYSAVPSTTKATPSSQAQKTTRAEYGRSRRTREASSSDRTS